MEKDVEINHHKLKADDGVMDQTTQQKQIEPASLRYRYIAIGTAAVLAVLAVLVFILFLLFGGREKNSSQTDETRAKAEAQPGTGNEVVLPAEALEGSKIEIEGVTLRPAVAHLKVTGTVQPNQEKTQQVTPLVGGRIEHVFVALGDRVRAGAVLVTIASPQVAELRGNLLAAQTKLALAQRNFQRAQRAENRVAVRQAKAKLDEAEATLRRTRRLIELGAGAGKDLIAAETAYNSAKAEYEFQSNIALSREVQEAQAAVETARSEVAQLRQSLTALGATPGASEGNSRQAISLIPLRAPGSGSIIERLTNPGAGIEAGKPLFTIANLSTVWVIANVPEAQVGNLRVGAPAEIRSAALGSGALAGRVNYIDPKLDEETRTARVRVEVPNRGERLKVDMFVEVSFQSGMGATTSEDLMVSSEAVQRIADRSVVFIPRNEPGHFEVRDVELGGEIEGYRRVLSGLKAGDRVVTKGSFLLKSQMLKGQFAEDEEGEQKN